jgi:hypothetical protein
MAADLSAGLTTSRPTGRRFGLEIGVAAVVVGALLARRHHLALAAAFAALGVVLLACAVLRPALLHPIARRWLAFGAALARVTTPNVLAIVYFAVLTPMALLRRTLGRSPFRRDPRSDSYWFTTIERTAEERRSRMERQF